MSCGGTKQLSGDFLVTQEQLLEVIWSNYTLYLRMTTRGLVMSQQSLRGSKYQLPMSNPHTGTLHETNSIYMYCYRIRFLGNHICGSDLT